MKDAFFWEAYGKTDLSKYVLVIACRETFYQVSWFILQQRNMDLDAYLYCISWIVLVNFKKSMQLKCFECDNTDNPACGVFFKSYQFNPTECTGFVKCGLQRQQPLKEQDNFIGIIRRCYYLGTLPGVNETDGCRSYAMPPHNLTSQYCFCSEDYCNGAERFTHHFLTRVLMTAFSWLLYNSFCR